jgi:signal peptidase I
MYMLKRKKSFEWLKAIIVGLLLAFVLRTFLFSSYEVFGQSMSPTVEEGNRLIINKVGYVIGEPSRFDLIVFHANEKEDFIKRVIGVPGDTIEYKNDVLYINGQKYDEPYLDRFKKDLGLGKLTGDFKLMHVTGTSRVPKGHVFVLGDNRRFSKDSRHIGFVKIDSIVGEVNVRYWPFDQFKIMK